ncbi:hypothetical protein [Streptococcus equinus]|nr:hypothetical protein [Streptococcus equinus]
MPQDIQELLNMDFYFSIKKLNRILEKRLKKLIAKLAYHTAML